MKPIFQKPMDGQCMRAAIASMFEIPMEAAPKVQCDGHVWDADKKMFVCTIEEHKANYGTPERPRFTCDGSDHQDKLIQEWASRYGLRLSTVYVGSWGREAGPRKYGDFAIVPPGICIASGPSPRFEGYHAVVWDTRLRSMEMPMGQMIHDPAPVPEGTRPGIKHVDHFNWFEVEDPSLLCKLYELRMVGPQ